MSLETIDASFAIGKMTDRRLAMWARASMKAGESVHLGE